jgi:serine/threonine protein kinase
MSENCVGPSSWWTYFGYEPCETIEIKNTESCAEPGSVLSYLGMSCKLNCIHLNNCFNKNLFKNMKYDDIRDQYIVNGNIIYKYQRNLGQGGYGEVNEYTLASDVSNYPVQIAVKTGDIQDDKAIIEKLQRLNICSHVTIPSIYVENTDGTSFVVMEKIDGTLNSWRRKGTHITLKIIKSIASGMLCLLNGGLLYTDAKLDNIFYRNNGPNGLDIILGDLGSIADRNSNGMTRTFPAINDFDLPYASESDIVWGIGIIYLSLSGYKVGELYASIPYNDRRFNLGLIRDKYVDDNKNNIDLFDSMLTTNSTKRATLRTLIDKIDNLL